ncbi:MAG: hypothetical protein AAF202_10530, partial [Pseudomonadota bacterium]
MKLLGLAIIAAMIFPNLASARTEREDRLDNTYLLRHRETGKVKQFHKTNRKQAKKALNSAGLGSQKSNLCENSQRFPDSKVELNSVSAKPVSSEPKSESKSEDIVLQRLELSILIEAFSTREQTSLTDSQLDWVQGLDLCDDKTRNGLR